MERGLPPVQSITRRWLRGSLLITICILAAALGLFLYYSHQNLYGGVQRAMQARFSTVEGRLQATGTAGSSQATSESRSQSLRQHGLPGKKTDSMEDLFPSGQLVTSPAQEQAKILYLKEQLLEKMLRGMEGVVSAQVSIAESAGQHRREPPTLSASVFIKHSPEVNLANREADIRHLVFNGIPNLQPEKISLLLQATAYRYQPRSPPPPGAAGWLASRRPVLIALLAGLAVALGALALWFRRHPAWR